jgi:hypothetical protein
MLLWRGLAEVYVDDYFLIKADWNFEQLPDKPALAAPFSTLTEITVKRPLLQYPAVVCTGKHTNPENMLKLDVSNAAAQRREPGLPDPDVDHLVITVEAESFPHDPLATDGIFQTIFVTTRSFPADYFQSLNLEIKWEDQEDATKFRHIAETQTSGPLTLPRARTLRIRIAAACKYVNFVSSLFGPEFDQAATLSER